MKPEIHANNPQKNYARNDTSSTYKVAPCKAEIQQFTMHKTCQDLYIGNCFFRLRQHQICISCAKITHKHKHGSCRIAE